MIVYGSGISDGNCHTHDDLPILLAGKANGTIKTGRHVRCTEGDALNESVCLDARSDGSRRRRALATAPGHWTLWRRSTHDPTSLIALPQEQLCSQI